MTDTTESLRAKRPYVPQLYTARRVGHTRAMLEGSKHTPGVVIVAHSQRYAEELADQCDDAKGIGLYMLDRLRGRVQPVVFDHHAVEILLAGWAQTDSLLASALERLEAYEKAPSFILGDACDGCGGTDWIYPECAALAREETTP